MHPCTPFCLKHQNIPCLVAILDYTHVARISTQTEFFKLIIRSKIVQICNSLLEINNYLNCPKMCILLLLRETNSLPISASDNKSVFSLFACKPCASLICFEIYILWYVAMSTAYIVLKLLSLIRLVAGETNISLVTVITSENNPCCGLSQRL